ncbi:hypothetical protein IKF84_03125 [Candidatus Saccharibacteria bacterium]|nr:hypothetical protein [Candidatus Saccharibacteria bacterium]
MYFIYILVIAVAILTILAAIALVFGSSKSEKAHSLWFLSAAIGEVIWAVSIAVFLSLGSGDFDKSIAPSLVNGIYIGAILMDVSILGYVSWRYKLGKILTSIFLIAGIGLATILVYDPSVLYSEIVLGNGTASLSIDMSKGFYYAYEVYFCLLIPAFCGFLIYKIGHTTRKKAKKGYLFFLIGLAVAGLLSGIFDLLMPPFRYDLIWIGPLAIGLIILGFYFSILKFKMVNLNSAWLKILSSVVLLNSAFIIYFLIFHLIFSALFKVNSPSFQVILLNFIMIAVVLALVPAFSEIANLVKSLILTKQIDLPYIVKKLSVADHKKLDLKDVSGFLAEHMHFSYVAFLVKGKLFVADDCNIPSDIIAKISKLPAPTHGAWLNLNSIGNEALKDTDITRIAILTGANGEMIGQMIFGKPTSKTVLEHRDLVEIQTIVSLMGIIIEDGGRSKS